MPSSIIEFHPSAVAEASAARDWYRERNAKAAESFLEELEYAVHQVAAAPEQWPKFEHNTRRYVFPRYPFNLIYRIEENRIQVLAVAHQRRKPGYWGSRK